MAQFVSSYTNNTHNFTHGHAHGHSGNGHGMSSSSSSSSLQSLSTSRQSRPIAMANHRHSTSSLVNYMTSSTAAVATPVASSSSSSSHTSSMVPVVGSSSPSTSWSPPSSLPSQLVYSGTNYGSSSSLSSYDRPHNPYSYGHSHGNGNNGMVLGSSPNDNHNDINEITISTSGHVDRRSLPTSSALVTPSSSSSSSSRGLFHCAVCDVCMTNEARDEHERGKKHARRVKKSAFAARNASSTGNGNGVTPALGGLAMHHSASSPSLSTQVNDRRVSSAMAIPSSRHGVHGGVSMLSTSPVGHGHGSSWSPVANASQLPSSSLSPSSSQAYGVSDDHDGMNGPAPRKGFYFCATCDIWMYSRDAEEHCSGKRHKKQVSLRYRGGIGGAGAPSASSSLIPNTIPTVANLAANGVPPATAAAVAMALAPPTAASMVPSLSLASSHTIDGRQSNRSASSPALASMIRSNGATTTGVPATAATPMHTTNHGYSNNHNYTTHQSYGSSSPVSTSSSSTSSSASWSASHVSTSSRYSSMSAYAYGPSSPSLSSPSSSYGYNDHGHSNNDGNGNSSNWSYGRASSGMTTTIEHGADVSSKSLYAYDNITPVLSSSAAAASSNPFGFSSFAGFSPLTIQQSSSRGVPSSSSSSSSSSTIIRPGGLWTPRY